MAFGVLQTDPSSLSTTASLEEHKKKLTELKTGLSTCRDTVKNLEPTCLADLQKAGGLFTEDLKEVPKWSDLVSSATESCSNHEKKCEELNAKLPKGDDMKKLGDFQGEALLAKKKKAELEGELAKLEKPETPITSDMIAEAKAKIDSLGSQLEKDRATLEKLSEAPKVDEGAKEKIAKLRKEIAENEKLAKDYEAKRKKAAEEGSNNKMLHDALSKKLPGLKATYDELEEKLQKALSVKEIQVRQTERNENEAHYKQEQIVQYRKLIKEAELEVSATTRQVNELKKQQDHSESLRATNLSELEKEETKLEAEVKIINEQERKWTAELRESVKNRQLLQQRYEAAEANIQRWKTQAGEFATMTKNAENKKKTLHQKINDMKSKNPDMEREFQRFQTTSEECDDRVRSLEKKMSSFNERAIKEFFSSSVFLAELGVVFACLLITYLSCKIF